MRELSLFTGAGGGLLGTHLLGWTPCGYVEWNEYCQRVIAARIADGYLPSAPIFTDVREFVQSGAAEQYRGIADVVTAGFPCQPFSIAGSRKGEDDERNEWPATLDVIRLVRPTHVLLENSPRLAVCGYAAVVTAGLANLGYMGANGVLGASDCGAPHRRKRLWFVADSGSGRHGVAQSEIRTGRNAVESGGEVVPNTDRWQRQERGLSGRVGRERCAENDERARTTGGNVWPAEPGMGRMANGVAYRVDRLKALGNGQVPRVVVRAWQEIAA